MAPTPYGASAQVATELELLETIAGFLPLRASSGPAIDDDELRMLPVLCRAFPRLLGYLGPRNKRFWREAMLREFSFAVDHSRTFNLDHSIPDWRQELGRRARHTYADPSCAERLAIDAWEAAHDHSASKILVHDLAWWSEIGAYFREHEYGFLGKIQRRERSLDDWPAHEDAFALFFDLAALKGRMRQFHDAKTWPGAPKPLLPCLLSPMAEPEPEDDFALIEHCGFVPHYRIDTMVDRWDGFHGPPPPLSKVPDDYFVHLMGALSPNVLFPYERDRDPRDEHKRSLLCRLAYELFSDWRDVRLQIRHHGPHFYIGQSKRSGRWLGLVGQDDLQDLAEMLQRMERRLEVGG